MSERTVIETHAQFDAWLRGGIDLAAHVLRENRIPDKTIARLTNDSPSNPLLKHQHVRALDGHFFVDEAAIATRLISIVFAIQRQLSATKVRRDAYRLVVLGHELRFTRTCLLQSRWQTERFNASQRAKSKKPRKRRSVLVALVQSAVSNSHSWQCLNAKLPNASHTTATVLEFKLEWQKEDDRILITAPDQLRSGTYELDSIERAWRKIVGR